MVAFLDPLETSNPLASLSFWRPRGALGALEQVNTIDEATLAIVSLPTLRNGATSFAFPDQREAFDLFMAGLSHGVSLGRGDAAAEVRKCMGVTILRRWPGSKPDAR